MTLYNVDLSKNSVKSPQSSHSYKELHRDVRILADFFASKKIRKIAVITEKNYYAYCLLWAAYESGVTFCSLNIDLPLKRTTECLTLFLPDMIVSDKKICGFNHISLQNLYSEAIRLKENNGNIIYPPSNRVMYVLFTSGSTGEPKGVAILRKAFEEVVDWAKDNFGITSEDTVGQYCNLSFDMGLCDVFLTLSVGAALVPITGISKLTPGRVIKSHEITCIYAVPTIIDIFEKNMDFEKNNLVSLRLVGFGGAPLYEKHMQYICAYNPSMIVYNTYGPTETTLFTSCVVFIAENFREITEKSVCLGNPITGVNYEIRDLSYNQLSANFRDDFSLCNEARNAHSETCYGRFALPKQNGKSAEKTLNWGCRTGLIKHDCDSGELIVTGSHCLAGYLSEAEKINYLEAESKGCFETGDLIYMKNENYYFISRKDNQVKIRGNRIDLDGIDSKISLFGISSVSMIIEEKLIVFYKGDISKIEIINMLTAYLPQNCLPDEFISLDVIPLNINGKYDRSELLNYYKKIKVMY